jgi:hypothetical protein
MGKISVLLLGMLVCLVWSGGCTGEGVRLIAPLRENLDEPSVYFLHRQAEVSTEVTIYLDPTMSEKHLTTGASGGICSMASIDVHIGRGINNKLQEGLKEVFPKVRFVTTDSIPAGSMSMNIEIKEVKIGFEFSPDSRGHGCNETSKMDKGWINLVAAAKLLDQTGNEIRKRTLTHTDRNETSASQLSYREEILENSLNKVTILLIRDIRKATNKNYAWHISIKMDEKALQGIPYVDKSKQNLNFQNLNRMQ